MRSNYLRRGWAAALAAALVAALAVIALALLSPGAAEAATALPSGFQESTVFGGLDHPTNVEFAPDGRVFVAEKGGKIKVFDGLSDTSPDTFADLSTEVHDFWDRGLLGLALDPNFPSSPYVYVLYTYDAQIGGKAPTWGDDCPTPPGATGDGCVVSGRLSRLQADPNTNATTGSEKVLIEDWCQQYPSHSVGDLAFGRDGALYVSGGDGASFNFADYGQDGSPANPCGDPPGGVGATLTPPSAEGGALRSQDLRTSGDPAGLNGAILRVDPATGEALPGNPLYSRSDPNARRIIASGQRNPFRLALRPGTGEVWAGDVGWGTWEEINRIADPTGSAKNFGWPCYEGNGRQGGYDGADLKVCEDLYGDNAVSAPYYAYKHSEQVVSGEACPTGGSITGLAFYGTGSYPAGYDGALFFADYSRNCIWAMRAGSDGLPDPSKLETFATGAAYPVDLKIGPGGDLFYVDIWNGTIRRISYGGGGGGGGGGTGAGPTATIDSPSSDLTWKVNDVIDFSGSATDEKDGTLQDSALSWSLIMHHCSPDEPTSCHEHYIQDYPGVSSGSFTAPDHEYPSYLELRLTATDSDGLAGTKSVLLEPQTVTLSFQSRREGLRLAAGDSSARTPFSRTAIVGSNVSISAPLLQRFQHKRYRFVSWSDGGPRIHNIVAPAADTAYTATYKRRR